MRPVVPMLAVEDAAAALDYYARVFGAVETFRMADGEGIAHAEFEIGGGKVMIADEYPGENVAARRLGGSPVQLYATVDDVDALVVRAQAEGCEIRRAPVDQPHGDRVAKLIDPFGHAWMFATRSR